MLALTGIKGHNFHGLRFLLSFAPKLGAAALAAALLAPSSGFGIGTRHDVPPELYRALAANTGEYESSNEIPDFSAVAAIGAPGRQRFDVVGSAVLINPQWVLTAAHVVMDPSGKGDFDRELRVRFGSNASTQFEEYAISEFHIPIPISKLKPLQGGIRYREKHVVYAEFHDIALLKLDRPVENITPIPYCGNWGARMLGRHVYIAGYGDSGHGANIREDSWAPAEVKRAAENQIDRDVTRNPFSNQQSGGLLLFDFDNGDPERNSLNMHSRVWNRLFGDGKSEAQPLDMEGASYPGDSGGPAIARIGSQWCVVGISGYGTGFPPGKRQTSIQYGDILVYTRVASHANWIQNTIQTAPAAAEQQLVAIFHEEPVKRGLFGRPKAPKRDQIASGANERPPVGGIATSKKRGKGLNLFGFMKGGKDKVEKSPEKDKGGGGGLFKKGGKSKSGGGLFAFGKVLSPSGA